MEIISNTSRYELEKIITILKKNRITGEEKYKHLIMFGEAKVHAQMTPYELDRFILAYCNFWDLKY